MSLVLAHSEVLGIYSLNEQINILPEDSTKDLYTLMLPTSSYLLNSTKGRI